MAQPSHLDKAPIAEAILDIRVRPSGQADVGKLLSLYDNISHQYPQKKERHAWHGKIEFAADRKEPLIASGSKNIDGYLFTSADNKRVFQARIDGFTFNRLQPYENWEVFRDEAHRLWQLYRKLVPDEIVRVALRYINKFNIPLPISDFGEFLPAAPIIPVELPQGLSGFLTRVIIPDPSIGATAIVSQVVEHIADPHLLPVILDIDVFQQKDTISEDDAWKALEELRRFKNRIFFASIMEKAKELFK